MADFWEKVKGTMEQSAKTLKDAAISVSGKTQEMVSLGQLKLKHYNLSRDVSRQFTELGGHIYELIKQGQTSVYSDAKVKELIDKVKQLEVDISEVEQEMENINQDEEDVTEVTETDTVPKKK